MYHYKFSLYFLLYCIFGFISCINIFSNTEQPTPFKKKITIWFTSIPGAAFYEIKLLESKEEKKHFKIVKALKSPYKGVVNKNYQFFQVRAVFNAKITTSWSNSFAKNTGADSKKEKDIKKYEINTQSVYKTILKIEKPFLYKKNHLWLGPKTLVILANKKYNTEASEIYYRFTSKSSIFKDEPFQIFSKPLLIGSLLNNIEDLFFLEYYSVYHQHKFKESIKKISIFIDTKPPIILFKELHDRYTWQFSDRSQILEFVYKDVSRNIITKKNTSSLSLLKSEVNDMFNMKLTISDLLHNTVEWKHLTK